MSHVGLRLVLIGLAVFGPFVIALGAQGGSAKSSLSGTVVDSAGGVLPGATVVVKNLATGVETVTVTNTAGAFDVPALDAGKYSVDGVAQRLQNLGHDRPRAARRHGPIASRSRWRSAPSPRRWRCAAARSWCRRSPPRSRRRSAPTRWPALPLVARNALNFVVFLPGVDTSSTNHSQRSSTIMGLPQSTLSITVDGANVQDKYTRSSDGFFANIQPRLDMVEEVTVSAATAGADSSGQGAVQIKFVTRSGTNRFVGSVY